MKNMNAVSFSTDSILAELQNYRINNTEWDITHFTYKTEKNMMNLFLSGNADEIIKLYDKLSKKNQVGIMSNSNLKQVEYSAVIAVSLSIRLAMENGLDAFRGYALNDLYLQKISIATSVEQYHELMKSAIRVIYNEISKSKNEKNRLLITEKAKQYVASNLTKKFTVDDIAAYAGISQSRLSAVFSQNEQITLKEYILQERVNAAKNMLKYSDYSLGLIAEYLCFSSQSHFGRVFKKYTGYTPNEYRNKYGAL